MGKNAGKSFTLLIYTHSNSTLLNGGDCNLLFSGEVWWIPLNLSLPMIAFHIYINEERCYARREHESFEFFVCVFTEYYSVNTSTEHHCVCWFFSLINFTLNLTFQLKMFWKICTLWVHCLHGPWFIATKKININFYYESIAYNLCIDSRLNMCVCVCVFYHTRFLGISSYDAIQCIA